MNSAEVLHLAKCIVLFLRCPCGFRPIQAQKEPCACGWTPIEDFFYFNYGVSLSDLEKNIDSWKYETLKILEE